MNGMLLDREKVKTSTFKGGNMRIIFIIFLAIGLLNGTGFVYAEEPLSSAMNDPLAAIDTGDTAWILISTALAKESLISSCGGLSIISSSSNV